MFLKRQISSHKLYNNISMKRYRRRQLAKKSPTADWWDRDCEAAKLQKVSFLARFRETGSNLDLKIYQTVKGVCPRRFVPHEGSCYMWSPVAMTSNGALTSCDAHGSRGVIVDDAPLNSFIGTLRPADEIWLAARRKPAVWSWISQQPITWEGWNKQTAVNKNPDFCLRVSDSGSWSEDLCSNTHSYVCEQPFLAYECVNSVAPNSDLGTGCSIDKTCCQYEYVIATKCPGNLVCCYKTDICGGPVGFCPNGWTEIGPHCYKFSSTQSTFDQAESACVAAGGHLADITDAAENSDIAGVIPAGSEAWAGLQSTGGNFAWYNGSDVAWAPWADSFPTLDSEAYDHGCVLRDINGLWQNDDCLSLRQYSCQTEPVDKGQETGFQLLVKGYQPDYTPVDTVSVRSTLKCAELCQSLASCGCFAVTQHSPGPRIYLGEPLLCRVYDACNIGSLIIARNVRYYVMVF